MEHKESLATLFLCILLMEMMGHSDCVANEITGHSMGTLSLYKGKQEEMMMLFN